MSEIKLDMRLKQALRISPQLLQSTQILQMNAQNLREYVDKALEENPVLDKAPEYEAQREFQELCRQAGWISGQGVRTGSSSGEDPYRPEAGAWDTAMTSLSAFLSDQLGRKALSKPLRELCRYLVQVLDEDGFLEQEDIDAVCALGVPQELVQQAVDAYGDKLAVGIDAKHDMVATEGWTEDSQMDFIDLAKAMEKMGVATIIYTDIGRDGTLSGPDVQGLDRLNKAVGCNVIASGGVTTITDILVMKDKKMYGTICGKCIYKKTLDLREAVGICK